MSKETLPDAGVPSEYLLDLTKGPDNQPANMAPDQTQTPSSPEDDLPEKYKGKSLKEVIEMHQNAESALGRAHNEVGQVRRLADELLGINRPRAATPAPEAPQRKKLTPDDILADPDQAVLSIVQAEAQTREAAQGDRLARLETELAMSRFERKHPGFQQTMDDPGFQRWVQSSPYRGRLAIGAMQGDIAAADELFTLYGEIQSAGTQQATPDPTEQARRAGLTRSGGSTAARVVDTAQGKPIWSREKLLELRLNNPDEFERLQPEILKAYAEKRVR